MGKRRRAVGIVRVSHVGTRSGDSFTSPDVQRERITAECEREGIELLEVFDELDVSGGKPLAQRPGLLRAVEMVESGEAQVIVAAYFDRLVRSLTTQAEVLERVERAGGKVRAVDTGEVGTGTSSEWLNATMRGMFADYQRRQAGERTREADIDAIRRGVAPWPIPPTGYIVPRTSDGSAQPYVIDETIASALRAAFALRATGASLTQVQTQLAADGVKLSHKGVGNLLSNRAYVGELHWGAHHNLSAWPAMVPADVFERCQEKRLAPRGPQTPSARILARLGVLRCSSCDGRLTVNGVSDSAANYRCPTIGCRTRVSISAKPIEEAVITATRAALLEVQGVASMVEQRRTAELVLERAQADLDAAVRVLAAVGDEQSAIDRLAELRALRDDARDALLRFDHAAVSTIGVLGDWDSLRLDERRALIRAAVRRVIVGPGRGMGRVRIELATSSAA